MILVVKVICYPWITVYHSSSVQKQRENRISANTLFLCSALCCPILCYAIYTFTPPSQTPPRRKEKPRVKKANEKEKKRPPNPEPKPTPHQINMCKQRRNIYIQPKFRTQTPVPMATTKISVMMNMNSVVISYHCGCCWSPGILSSVDPSPMSGLLIVGRPLTCRPRTMRHRSRACYTTSHRLCD